MRNLLSIGNSVTLFFAFMLVTSVIVIFTFDDDVIHPYATSSDIPKIELNNFTLYQINDENLLIKLNAQNAKQFEKFEELNGIVLERLNNNILDKLTAKSAIKRGETIYFDNGVTNSRQGYDFSTERGIYYIDTNKMSGDSGFKLDGKYQNVIGDSVFYDAKAGILEATNINAKIRIEKK